MDAVEKTEVIDFFSMGCDVCRKGWLSGKFPREIGTSILRHTHLHFCEHCGTFWEQEERFPIAIKHELAIKFFNVPQEILKKVKGLQHAKE